MKGSFGSPYRAPCGGWPTNRRWYIGGFWNHKRQSETALTRYSNSTTIGGVSPVEKLFTNAGWPTGAGCSNADCVGDCAPWVPSMLPVAPGYRDHNAYTTNGTFDASKCRRIGFKNVQAARIWHGRVGFTDDHAGCPIPQTGCACVSVELEHSTAPQTKYLTKTADASISSTYSQVYTAPSLGCQLDFYGTVSGHSHRQYTVGANTGIIHEDSCYDNWSASWHNGCDPEGPDYVSGTGIIGGTELTWDQAGLIDLTGLTAHCGRIEVLSEAGHTNSYAGLTGKTEAEVEAFFAVTINDAWTDGATDFTHVKNQSAVATFTNTSLSIVITQHEVYTYHSLGGAGELRTDTADNEITVTIGLTATNTWSAVQSDMKSLLNQWDLSDDVVYPWRQDDYATIAPLVTRREVKASVSPDIWTLNCGYIDPNTDNTYLVEPYDGSIRGAPLPAGYDRHFDFLHRSWRKCDAPNSFYAYAQGSWSGGGNPNGTGEATDDSIPGCATQWTENYSDWLIPPGTLPAGAWIYGLNGVCYGQKWAETKVPRLSHNFARPCGPDRDRLDETTVRCFTYAGGTLTVPTATAIDSGDIVYCCGHPDVFDGYYTATKTGALTYTLASYTDWPGTSAEIINCGVGIIGKVRWPTKPGICGRISISAAVQDGSDVNLTLAEAAPQLRKNDLVDFTGVGGLGASVTIKTVTDSTHFVVTGALSGAYSSGGYISSHGAASYEWNDTQWKGDYLRLEWAHNFRDYQERDRVIQQAIDCAGCPDTPAAGSAIRTVQAGNGMDRSVTAFSCEQLCCAWTVCAPYVLCYSDSTQDDWSTGGYTHALGSVDGDDRYGSLWQGAYAQQMEDIYWQTPHSICEGSPPSFRVDWVMDSGDCLQDYARRPLIEARDGSPVGAPAMATGYSLHVLTLTECQSGSPPDGIVIPPTSGLGYVPSTAAEPNKASTPWGIYIAQESCVCHHGTFETDYKEDGVSCPV